MLLTGMESFPEIWVLVFQELVGDNVTLRNISLVSRAWRTLSWPCLLQLVDISSHNIQRRLTEHECCILPVIYSSHHAKYRPPNLVPRQRAFLRLIIAQPALAKYVKSFTWTLVWKDTWEQFDVSSLSDIDRETWNVFARLVYVTKLDLASIHDVWDDDIICNNPAHLFPKVNDLRLLGWMHRGLVKAILSSIDTTKLRSLKLDYLEDQGAFPGGHPMNMEVAEDFAKVVHRISDVDGEHIIDDKLFQRQEMGKAAIFPGPMWFPMRLLSDCSLDSLSHLQISLLSFDMGIDIRNYKTTFRHTARLLCKASRSLKSLVVNFGESTRHYYPQENHCGTSKVQYRSTYRPLCIEMAATFLKELLIALSESPFPYLKQLTFEGFHLLESEEAGPDFGGTLPYLRDCRFDNVSFTSTPHVYGRWAFPGFDCAVPEYDDEVLRNS